MRAWLRAASGRVDLPGGVDIAQRFDAFTVDLPDIGHRLRLAVDEMTFADYYGIAAIWLDEHVVAKP